jgi:transposase
MTAEVWKPWPEAPVYEASTLGRVRRGGRVLAPITQSNGYIGVNISVGGKRKRVVVHKMVLETHVGPKPSGHEGRHYPNRDRSDCRLENLSWSTHGTNMDDQVEHGTRLSGESFRAKRPKWQPASGESNGLAKLTLAGIAEAESLLAEGLSRLEVSKRLNVSESAIALAAVGKTWKGAMSKTYGGVRRGSRSGTAKLDEAKVVKIRHARAEGLTYQQIADLFEVHLETIRLIILRRTWAHVA